MVNKMLIRGVAIVIFFIITGCKKDNIIKYDGYALLNYYRLEDRKQIEIILLHNYDIKNSLESYLNEKDTLSRLITYMSSNNVDFDKVLDTKLKKQINSANLYSFVRIKYKLNDIALEWSNEEIDSVRIGETTKICRNYSFSNLNDKNNLSIGSIEYLPLILGNNYE